jgi:hypothetical protein
MDKLRGSGNTFSISGKHWRPFRFNPKIAKRNARLHRLIKAEIIKPQSKQELAAEAPSLVAAYRAKHPTQNA